MFVTFRKLNRDPLAEAARNLVLQHCLFERGRRIELHASVIMPDHVHLLFTPLRDEEGRPYLLHKIMKAIKGTSARDINKLLGVSGPVRQEESFDHVLRSEESLQEKIEYIRMNPVRGDLSERPRNTRGFGFRLGLVEERPRTGATAPHRKGKGHGHF